jgi:hypothetical protein
VVGYCKKRVAQFTCWDWNMFNDDPIQYYRNNRDLPKFSESCPNVKEIFNICLLHNVPEQKLVKIKLTRIKKLLRLLYNKT